MSRRRRRQPVGWAHWGAPAAFLVAVTIAVLLVHSALNGHPKSPPPPAVETHAVTNTETMKTRPHHAAATKRVYATVQSGDTFGSIAARQGISVEQLQALNPGVSSNSLQVGQKLRVK